MTSAESKVHQLIQERFRRVLIHEYMAKAVDRAGFGGLTIQRTPLGTRITINTERPGLVIGRKGRDIQRLTDEVERIFELENPQIEAVEVRNVHLNPQIMASKLVFALERGWNFRRAGNAMLQRVMESGARGCQITLTGKLTGQRHRTEKFISGHIKHCGETALQLMQTGFAVARRKEGVIGCKVAIMLPDARLPDEVTIRDLAAEAEAKAKAEEAARRKAEARAAAEAAAQAAQAAERVKAQASKKKEAAAEEKEPAPEPKAGPKAKPKAKDRPKAKAEPEVEAAAPAPAPAAPAEVTEGQAEPAPPPAAPADDQPKTKPEKQPKAKPATPKAKAEAAKEQKVVAAKPKGKPATPKAKAEAVKEQKLVPAAKAKAKAATKSDSDTKAPAEPVKPSAKEPEADPASSEKAKDKVKAETGGES